MNMENHESGCDCLAELAAWYAERPQAIKDMLDSHPGCRRYSMPTGQHAEIISYSENGTVRVHAWYPDDRNVLDAVLELQVFGVPLSDLTPIEPQEATP